MKMKALGIWQLRLIRKYKRKLQPTNTFLMTDEIDFKTLQNRFKNIKELYSRANYKYIHSKTVDNFLYNADDSFMQTDKKEIYNRIVEYIEVINSSNQIDNAVQSVELYNEYIRPLTPFFTQLKGFHMAFRLWVVTLWTFCIFALLYLLSAPVYFYAIVVASFIFFISRQLFYDRKRKTYGFMH